MRVRVLRNFRDRTAELELRKTGTILEVNKERADRLIGLELAERIRDPVKKDAKEEKEI